MRFREIELPSGTKIFLGKNAENNDELMKKFKDKPNIILHTVSPGSPFCVIEKLDPGKSDINASGVYCVRYSQYWRENKTDTKVHVFTGKDVKKRFWMRPGTWKVQNAKVIKIKKMDVLRIKNNDTRTSSTGKKRNN